MKAIEAVCFVAFGFFTFFAAIFVWLYVFEEIWDWPPALSMVPGIISGWLWTQRLEEAWSDFKKIFARKK